MRTRSPRHGGTPDRGLGGSLPPTAIQLKNIGKPDAAAGDSMRGARERTGASVSADAKVNLRVPCQDLAQAAAKRLNGNDTATSHTAAVATGALSSSAA